MAADRGGQLGGGNPAGPRADLRALEALWLDRLQPSGERGYHDTRVSR